MDKIDDLRMGDRAETLQVPQFSSWASCGFVELFQQGFLPSQRASRRCCSAICHRLLCVIPEPACLPSVLEQIIVRRNAGAGPIAEQMEEIANDLIQITQALSIRAK